MKINRYISPKTLNEAYEVLIANPKTRVIGGLMGLGKEKTKLETAIDLKYLDLKYKKSKGNSYCIGAMCVLSDLEQEDVPEVLRKAFRKANDSVGGVQMRNQITVGGIVVSGFGKSNLLTILSACHAKLVFYKAGRVDINDYLCKKKEKDILIEIEIPEIPEKIVFDAIYYDKADFPILNCAGVKWQKSEEYAIGARPQTARLLGAGKEISYGSDIRASAAYRKEVSVVLENRVREVMAYED